MAIKVEAGVTTAMAAALVNDWNFRSSVYGHMQLRTGTGPADIASPDTGTLVIQLSCLQPMWIHDGNNTFHLSVPVGPQVAAAGIAGHWRMIDDAAVAYMQGTCNTSTGDIVFNSVNFQSGDTCTINSLVIQVDLVP